MFGTITFIIDNDLAFNASHVLWPFQTISFLTKMFSHVLVKIIMDLS